MTEIFRFMWKNQSTMQYTLGIVPLHSLLPLSRESIVDLWEVSLLFQFKSQNIIHGVNVKDIAVTKCAEYREIAKNISFLCWY